MSIERLGELLKHEEAVPFCPITIYTRSVGLRRRHRPSQSERFEYLENELI